MATYVVSDIHGYSRALDRALELASPGDGDLVCVLGDMVDRGPDPLGVVRIVRSLPSCRVLMGNHERIMLDALASGDAVDMLGWERNGGSTTLAGLSGLTDEAYGELLTWVERLPLFDTVSVGGRVHILVHAGIDAPALRAALAELGYDGAAGYGDVPEGVLRAALALQSPETLLWTRGPFWEEPTGLIGPDGRGPRVISGHTPSVLLGRYASRAVGPVLDGDERALMVEVGACFDSFGVADRIDIDASAAAGAPFGQVGIMRLDDLRCWYAPVGEDA